MVIKTAMIYQMWYKKFILTLEQVLDKMNKLCYNMNVNR